MKRVKTFKALDKSQLEAFVQNWLDTTKPKPKIVGTEESTVMASVPYTTAKGTKNRRRQVLQLKVRYE
jgi:hypothetical protein